MNFIIYHNFYMKKRIKITAPFMSASALVSCQKKHRFPRRHP